MHRWDLHACHSPKQRFDYICTECLFANIFCAKIAFGGTGNAPTLNLKKHNGIFFECFQLFTATKFPSSVIPSIQFLRAFSVSQEIPANQRNYLVSVRLLQYHMANIIMKTI